MMYDEVAKHYDALVKDDEATKDYVKFVEEHSEGKEVLELACGSGELSLYLANKHYYVDASDISLAMLEEATKKDAQNLVNFFEMDMSDIHVEKAYDTILCFCDSINYIPFSSVISMFEGVYQVLKKDGVFLFDMHSQDRLSEFSEEYYEAGKVDGVEYTWSIIADEERLYHNFVFYDNDANPTFEQHIQYVFKDEDIQAALKEIGFEVIVYTDFTNEGIQAGEKYFYVARKV